MRKSDIEGECASVCNCMGDTVALLFVVAAAVVVVGVVVVPVLLALGRSKFCTLCD